MAALRCAGEWHDLAPWEAPYNPDADASHFCNRPDRHEGRCVCECGATRGLTDDIEWVN